MHRIAIWLFLFLSVQIAPAAAQQFDVTIANPLQIIDQGAFVEEFGIPMRQGFEFTAEDIVTAQDSLLAVDGFRIESSGGRLSAGPFDLWTLPDVTSYAGVATTITRDEAGAKRFRDLLTVEKGQVSFQSRLGSAEDLVLATGGVAQDTISRWQTAAVAPETLQTFQANSAAIAANPGAFLDMLRMVNGVPVSDRDAYPEAVMLKGSKRTGEPELCSGVAVAPRLIITASHCVCVMTVTDVFVGSSPVDPGATRMTPVYTESFLPCSIFESEVEFGANIGKGDIGVVKLGQDLPPMQFARFASDSTLRLIRSVRAVGFGVSNLMGGSEFLLRGKYAADIVVASIDCREMELLTPETDYRCQATHEMIAAGDTDTCRGDSGGPAFVFALDRMMYLGAITSRSVDPNGSCGRGGIYVKLNQPQFRDWLLQQGVPQTAWAS